MTAHSKGGGIAQRQSHLPDPVKDYWMQRAPYGSAAWLFTRVPLQYREDIAAPCWWKARFMRNGSVYCDCGPLSNCTNELLVEVMSTLLIVPAKSPLPVDIEWLASQFAKVELADLTGSYGMYVPPWTILIARRLSPVQRRATMAHEVVHILIKHAVNNENYEPTNLFLNPGELSVNATNEQLALAYQVPPSLVALRRPALTFLANTQDRIREKRSRD